MSKKVINDDLDKCPECEARGDWCIVDRYDFEDAFGSEGSVWIYKCQECGHEWTD